NQFFATSFEFPPGTIINDLYFIYVRLETHLDPTNRDTDGDGLLDGEELHTYGTSPLNPDTDYDTWTDYDEIYLYKTDPTNWDTDGDGVMDSLDVDPLVDLKLTITFTSFEIFSVGWYAEFGVGYYDEKGAGGVYTFNIFTLPPKVVFEFDYPDEKETVQLELLFIAYKTGDSHLIDISRDPDGYNVRLEYDARTASWTGDDGYPGDPHPGYSSGLEDGHNCGWEGAIGFNIEQNDYDNDGLTYWEEINKYRTDPTLWDTNGDGKSDYEQRFEYYIIANVDEDNIRAHIEVLSGEKYIDLNDNRAVHGQNGAVDMGDVIGWEVNGEIIHSRYSGTTGCVHAQSYIEQMLAQYLGQQNVETMEFTITDPGLAKEEHQWINGSTLVNDNFQYTSKNVIGTLGDPDATTYYVISAHYDTIWKEAGGYAYASREQPGADDNAVGVAAMLEIARVLSTMDLDTTIKFIAFSGEEQGMWGSLAYSIGHRNDDISGVINLDMVGYNL
ncbi:MAG: M20/M25/M40 family metallo-hydrolase, partial [Candidatus Thermoplasmatota archaeon]|nr:M20/M25/M40 family metallo-hydrolase [Candidatus Thermoplasmatota archaeon]